MAYLLDNALIWWWDEDERLGRHAADLLRQRREVVDVSAVSGLEIATKVRIGKLPNMARPNSDYPSNVGQDGVGQDGLRHLAILPSHARVGGLLPGTHRDPSDRGLAAQALMEGLTLITRDPCFTAFGCEVLW